VQALEALCPARPAKFILMSSVSVHRPGGLDTRRGAFEKAFVWMLRGLLPPASDNQQAADFLQERIGPSNPFVQWAVVRPDTLLEGDVSEYTVHEGLVSSLFAPGQTNMANVAHFMCELVTSRRRGRPGGEGPGGRQCGRGSGRGLRKETPAWRGLESGGAGNRIETVGVINRP